MKIKEATPQDGESLAGIIREGFQDVADRFALTARNCPKHPSNCTPEWISEDFERGVRYYLLEAGHAPAGCVGLEFRDERMAFVERLAVLPPWRRQGLATALLRHVLGEARESGARKVSVGIIAAHGELAAWYRGMGFAEVGTKEFPHLPFRVAFLERTL